MLIKVFLLCLLSSLTQYFILISSSPDTDFCATLYNNENHVGETLTMTDGSSYGNLENEYITPICSWNETKSWRIANGCLLTVCNGYYYGGICHELETSTSSGLNLEMKSANCTCHKDFLCSDVRMKTTSCARAYLSSSCNTFNPTYTELIKGRKDFFNFQSQVKSILVRQGCQLKIYDEENFDGEYNSYQHNVENYESGIIGSYECDCENDGDDPTTAHEELQRNPNFPPLIDIPEHMNDVFYVNKHTPIDNHIATTSALQSTESKRSSKNAYILVLGTTGSGKSSSINLLLDNTNVTKIGDGASTTAAIHEFRIPIVVDELGLKNGELRIIDTPGLGDTAGIERDARILASLDEFLKNHEELKYRIPNVVLIFHKFTDNRFDGISSTFVKVLRSLDLFRSRISDKHFSNIIFVFTHFGSEAKEVVRNPKSKLLRFKEVIENYSLFPKPIMIVVGENKAAGNGFPLVNGLVKLPNGEYFPKNLIDKIGLVTRGGSDPIGRGIFQTAFNRNTNLKRLTEITTPYLDSVNSQITKYLSLFQSTTQNIENSEVSQLISTAYQTMDNELKYKHPDSKGYLQKSLYLRNIFTREDIPRTTLNILKLLKDIRLNQAILYLLEHGLQINPLKFQENNILGSSYNLLQDNAFPSSPIQTQNFQASTTGFLFPSLVAVKVNQNKKTFCSWFANMEQYLEHHIKKQSLYEKNIPLNQFKVSNPRSGCNIENITTTATKLLEFRRFELTQNLNQVNFTKEFREILNSLSPFNETSNNSVDKWKKFFRDYGTHIVERAWVGGSIEIQIEMASLSPLPIVNITLADLIENPELKHSIKFQGGSQAYQIEKLTNMNISQAIVLLDCWKESVEFNPTMLTSEIRIVPISQVVKSFNSEVSEMIEYSTDLFLNGTLNYNEKLVAEIMAREIEKQRIELEKKALELKLKHEAEQKVRERKIAEEQAKLELARKLAEEEAERVKVRFEEAKRQKEEEIRRENIRQQRLLEEQRIAIQRLKQMEFDRRQAEETRRRLELAAMEARRREAIRVQEEALERELAWQREINERNRQRKGCLRAGTMITLADGTEKPVDEIHIGDMVLDHTFQPTQVVSTLRKFLLDDKFYGFSDYGANFFTKTHLIGGSFKGENEAVLEFHVVDLEDLYDENPLLENYLHLTQFGSNFTNILTLDHKSTKMKLSMKRVKLESEPHLSTPDTLVYIFGVDSPHGTYFANGVVCRHELPPLELWPNTMNTLYQIMDSQRIDETIQRIDYTVENVRRTTNMIQEINKVFLKNVLNNIRTLKLIYDRICEEKKISDPKILVAKVLNEQMHSVVGMELYSTLGKFLYKIFDNPNLNFNSCIQQLIVTEYKILLLQGLTKI